MAAATQACNPMRFDAQFVEDVDVHTESEENNAISDEDYTQSAGTSSESKTEGINMKRTISSIYVIEQCVGALCEERVTPPSLDVSMSSEMSGRTWEDLPGWLRPAIMNVVLKCRQNSKTPIETDDTSLQCDFECIDVPAVSIEEYAGVIYTSFPSLMTWARAMVLLYKFCRLASIEMTEYTIHRLLVTAVVATARFQGECCGTDESWGITEDDLAGMESSFHYVLGGDYSVTIESCLKVLLPFDEAPSEAVLAAGLLSADRCPLSSKQRCAKWVTDVVHPSDDDEALLLRKSSSMRIKKKVEMFRAKSAASLSKLFKTNSQGKIDRRVSMS